MMRTHLEGVCSICGLINYDHPHDWTQPGYDGAPFLRVRCDGVRLKL